LNRGVGSRQIGLLQLLNAQYGGAPGFYLLSCSSWGRGNSWCYHPDAAPGCGALREEAHLTSTTPTPSRRVRLLRAHLGELLGMFRRTLVAAGGGVIAAVSGGRPDLASQAVAPGLLVVAMIYALGPTSGAHFNP